MKFLQSLLFFMFSFVSLWAQEMTITGKIMDSKDNSPIIGATVTILNTTRGTVSDADGKFSILAPRNSNLQVSYVGYGTQVVSVTTNDQLSILMSEAARSLDQVVVLGTRKQGRVAMETPVPVDVISTKQVMATTARMDLTSVMSYATPSLNYNKQSGSDGADHIDLATLRGLGPDQSLVLINGKRRHQTAFVSVFGTRGRGNSGTDLNAIPAAAIDRVEILRDGASAQYGSDAIAGVMNLILKKNKGLTANVGYSAYYDPQFNPAFKTELGQYIYENKLDGNFLAADLNYGIGLGKENSFCNITLNYNSLAKTYRQSLDQNFANDYGLPVNIYRRAHGDGSLNSYGAFLNAEYPLSNNLSVYANGGYNSKNADAYAFTRNFSARPDRFVTNANGDLVRVDGIIMDSKETETAGADQFFNPHIQTEVSDLSATIGLKRSTEKGWSWDLSNVIGKNNFHFFGDKTFNASLNDPNKTHFDDGGFSFLQNTSNFNLSKPFQVLSGLNLAAGAEFRLEKYNLFAGEEASYKNYDENKATGSQGFPGYQPSDEVDASRTAVGAYLEAELDVTKRWLLDAAVRAENYSDFGFTSNYKLATRYKVQDNMNVRASISTGFRAPSLQQVNFSSTFTTVQGGKISEVKLAPNYSSITKAAGIPELKQERSLNFSLGSSFRMNKNLNITYDFYYVRIKDRVVLSGQFDAEDDNLNSAFTSELKKLNVALAQFFANAVNTTNKGVDVVLDYSKAWNKSNLKLIAAGNFQIMSIDKINVPDSLNDNQSREKQFLSDREQAFILASAPNTKMAFTADYRCGKWGVGARLTHFGAVKILGYGVDGLGIDPQIPSDDSPTAVKDEYHYGAKWVTDLFISFRPVKSIGINLGVDNIFNIHPDLGAVAGAKWWAFNNETGGPWDAVQMGGNGRRLFARISYSF
ncbi:MAG TPA: TonB-dependent receptor [Saprospiraceae bacterium]|nr:TonB-dependent receptor [Saprospiraceae bacterium]